MTSEAVATSARPSPGWPLTMLLAGFPLWWAMGLDSILPVVLAVPMALQLLRRRTVTLPGGLGWWTLFLLWVTLGGLMLWADAPDAVPGADSSRLLLYGYRLAWYVACTVVLVWVTNLRREDLPDEHVRRLVAWIFVVATAGGVLGLLAPGFEIRSPVEMLLPTSIAENTFVSSLVHPQAADVQVVLGYPETRPKAPFPFTNTWGSMLSLSLVFLLAVDLRGHRVAQVLRLAVVGVALVPIVYSLNRGLWACLAVGLLAVLAIRLVRGDRAVAVGLAAAVAVGGVLLLASPLGTIYSERLEHGHSNERRGQLLTVTTASVTEGSPVLGFGSTRDVQGSFASITGASTPDCPACGVPPMGTQGQLWLVLFSQGWPGLLFFLIFVGLALRRCWRCRTTNETVCLFTVGFFVLQLPIYDTLGLPLLVVMVAIGLVAREQAAVAGAPAVRFTPLVADLGLRRVLALALGPALVGALAGATFAASTADTSYRAKVSILITPSPVYLDTGAVVEEGDPEQAAADAPREITVDTEAALLESLRALTRASARSGVPVAELRDSLAVTAPPSSQVLDVTVDSRDPERAEAGAAAVADSYLQERRTFLTQRRDRLILELREELRSLDPTLRGLEGDRARVTAEISYLVTSNATIGRVVRHDPAQPVRPQTEVPVASGAALGLLLGLAALRRLAIRRPRPHRLPVPPGGSDDHPAHHSPALGRRGDRDAPAPGTAAPRDRGGAGPDLRRVDPVPGGARPELGRPGPGPAAPGAHGRGPGELATARPGWRP